VLEATHYVSNVKGLVYYKRKPLEDDAPVLAATAMMLKIAERRAKLVGLDAPSKKIIEVTNYDGIDADVKRLVDELATRGQDATAPGAFAPRVVLEVPEPAGAGSGD
jgi:hypothetical protein